MKVYVVCRTWSDEKTLFDHSEIVGVYSTEEKAREIQEELINENARDVINLGCDQIDVTIDECEVE